MSTDVNPKEVRNINEKELDIIANHIQEIDGDLFSEEDAEDFKRDLLNAYTKVFVFEFGVYVVSISFCSQFVKHIDGKKANLSFSQDVLRFFIDNDNECNELTDDEFMFIS
jgi:hypothetical protein